MSPRHDADKESAKPSAAEEKSRRWATPSPLQARLHELLGKQTYADIARATGCNSETVRRYMRGGVPSIQFVVGVAQHYRVSLDWLLLGEGAPRRADVARAAMPQPERPAPHGAVDGVVVRQNARSALQENVPG